MIFGTFTGNTGSVTPSDQTEDKVYQPVVTTRVDMPKFGNGYTPVDNSTTPPNKPPEAAGNNRLLIGTAIALLAAKILKII